jgi:hypothetical protein
MARDRGEIIKGEFFTDGATFVFRLNGTPFSGTGDTPGAAFDNLLQTKAAAGALPERLAEFEREQDGERVRAALIRTSGIGIIVLGLFGGLIFGTAAMLPRVVGNVTDMTTQRLSNWIDNMPPATEQRLAGFLQKIGGGGACKLPAEPAAGAKE